MGEWGILLHITPLFLSESDRNRVFCRDSCYNQDENREQNMTRRDRERDAPIGDRREERTAIRGRDSEGQDDARRGRRLLVKSAIASGGVVVVAHGLSPQWSKPVIESVVLPAHAQTSTDSESSSNSSEGDSGGTSGGSGGSSGGYGGNFGNAGNASDIRLKTQIRHLAVSPSGHQLYRFQYKNDPTKKNYVGLMAQDVISTHPQAVSRRSDGYLMVRYNLLGLRMASLEEWNQSGMDSVLSLN